MSLCGLMDKALVFGTKDLWSAAANPNLPSAASCSPNSRPVPVVWRERTPPLTIVMVARSPIPCSGCRISIGTPASDTFLDPTRLGAKSHKIVIQIYLAMPTVKMSHTILQPVKCTCKSSTTIMEPIYSHNTHQVKTSCWQTSGTSLLGTNDISWIKQNVYNHNHVYRKLCKPNSVFVVLQNTRTHFIERVHGVVVSHPLRMRRCLSSIASVSNIVTMFNM